MRNGSFAWADFDNDHDLDLFVCGDVFARFGFSVSRIYRNDVGTLVDTGIVLPPYRSSSADWADFDNDGFVDLLLTGLSDYDPPGTRIFRNLGGSNLVEFARLDGVYDGRAAWGDFNQDGYPDLALTGAGFGPTAGTNALYVNVHGTNFARFAQLSPHLYYGTVDWADYDHDGDLDLLRTGEGIPLGAFLVRNDANTFSTVTQLLWASGVSGQWFDANNDGWSDLLILAHSDANSYVLLNDQAGGFTRYADLGGLGAFTVADLNNDGFSDAVMLGYRYYPGHQNFTFDWMGLYLNSGAGSWVERTEQFPQLGGGAAAAGDYDGDGRVDLIFHGQSTTNNRIDYSTWLYRNVTPRTNQPPRPPDGLHARMEGDHIVLHWNAATDPDQTNGLTYNVRVGSAPGMSDIVQPLSAPDGWRQVVKRGNADGRTSYILRGLHSQRRYYWSVQSIDAAFSGSIFAKEEAFTFRIHPVASNQLVTLNEDTARIITLAGLDADDEPLTFTLLSSPTNGMLVGAAPNLVYTPRSNFFGGDSFEFKVSNSVTDSLAATVDIQVLPVNDAPVADTSATHASWLSANGVNALVQVNGSRSSDVDGDALNIRWTSAGGAGLLATGAVARIRLPVGRTSIGLAVDDGEARATDSIIIEVLTPGQAIGQLMMLLSSHRLRSPSLIRTLSNAAGALERGNSSTASRQLRAFQKQVHAQARSLDPTLADQVMAGAQAIMNVLESPPSPQSPGLPWP
jgi:hypothetical protein